MENGCSSTTEDRIESASNQIMRIVIGIGGGPVKSNGRPDNRPPGSAHRFTQEGFQP